MIYMIFSGSKYVKLVMLNKTKQKKSKEKEKSTSEKTNVCYNKDSTLNKTPPKLPKLLPLTNVKKGLYLTNNFSPK